MSDPVIGHTSFTYRPELTKDTSSTYFDASYTIGLERNIEKLTAENIKLREAFKIATDDKEAAINRLIAVDDLCDKYNFINAWEIRKAMEKADE